MISLIAGLFLGLWNHGGGVGAGVGRALLTLPVNGGLSEE